MTEKAVKLEDEKSPRNERYTGRRNDRDRKKKQNKSKKKGTHYVNNGRSKKTSTFRGSIDGMNGHVFEMFAEGASTIQYTRTCEELEGYVLRNYKYGTDLQSTIRNMENVHIKITDDPLQINDTEGNAIPITQS